MMNKKPKKKEVNFFSNHSSSGICQTLFERAADIVFIVDSEWRIIEVSRHGCEMLGYTHEEVLGMSVQDLLPEGDWANYELKISKSQFEEFELYTKDGNLLPVRMNIQALADGNMLGIVHDITNHKETVAALQQREALLSQAENVAQSGTFDWDLKTNTAKWSPGMHKLFEIPADKFNGDPSAVLNVLHPDDVNTMVQAMQDVINDKKMVSHIEYRIEPPSGVKRHIWAQGALILDEQGNVTRMIGVCRDITERKLSEDKIRQLNQELEQRVSERTAQLEIANKELESFAYSVSHDLRAPLRAINGFSQIFIDDYYDQVDEPGKDLLDRIQNAAKRMEMLIDDMLSLSRVNRYEMNNQTVNLSNFVHEIADELKANNPERQVEIVIEDDINVEGDGRLLRIALDNLMGNAWKFSSNNPTTQIEFGMKTKNNKQVCFIKDNGVGFNMKYSDKLFGAFQRLHTSTEFPGIGIGLAIVQCVFHRHGGEVWAEGKEENGATFYFTLPHNNQS